MLLGKSCKIMQCIYIYTYSYNCVDCFAGDSGVGKTCIIQRQCQDTFCAEPVVTVGLDCDQTRIKTGGKSMQVLKQ